MNYLITHAYAVSNNEDISLSCVEKFCGQQHVDNTNVMLPWYLKLLHVQLHRILFGSAGHHVRYHGEH